jgi:hypothetical protein
MDLPALGNHPFEIVSAVMTYKLLGPSAVYLGGKTRELAQKAIENIERVFINATAKLGSDIDKEGEVPPRVLRGIVNEAAFCEDKIATEYLGGVLASSRRDSSRDDRGVVMNALISRMSSYQLRTHYLFYHATKDLYDGTDQPMFQHPELVGIFFPVMCYYLAMGFHEDVLAGVGKGDEKATESAFEDIESLFSHTFFGLHKEGLLDGFERHIVGTNKSGIKCYPSPLGVELFLWAYGMGSRPLGEFLNPANQFKRDDSVILIPAYEPLTIQDGTGTAHVPGYRYASPYDYKCPVRRPEADLKTTSRD